jgi:hypothetical protein
MIQPLRRRHRRMILAIALALAGTAILAVTHPPPSARMETLPAAIIGDTGPGRQP